MVKTMTPSTTMTAGQIGKLCDLLSAALRKAELPNEPSQRVIEEQGGPLVDELVGVIRKRVEELSNLIVRKAKVNRSRSPQEAFDATGRKQYRDRKVVDSMPKGEGDEVEVVFFELGRFVDDDELEREYERRGLKPVDPYSLAAVNEADPAFADEKPNGTHWQDADGRWCFAMFNRRHDGHHVDFSRYDHDWNDRGWFAGVRLTAQAGK